MNAIFTKTTGVNHLDVIELGINFDMTIKRVSELIENDLSYKIRGCIFRVYNNLGPGLLESAYEAALVYELNKIGLSTATQVGLSMTYEGVQLDIGYRLDILVEQRVLIEIKSVEILLNVHHKQVLTYLKLSGLKLGILVNFQCDDISKSIFRKVNKL